MKLQDVRWIHTEQNVGAVILNGRSVLILQRRNGKKEFCKVIDMEVCFEKLDKREKEQFVEDLIDLKVPLSDEEYRFFRY